MRRLGRRRNRSGKSGCNRGSGANKATLGSKPGVLNVAKMLSVHLCLQLYFCLAMETTLSTVCRNINVLFYAKTLGADNKTTREG